MTGTGRERRADKEAPAPCAARFANAIGHQGLERYCQHSMAKITGRGLSGGLAGSAEPRGQVAAQVLLVVTEPRDVAVWPQQHRGHV
jgi:hypothetical protein